MSNPPRTPVTLSARARSALVPGWKGKRYWACSDGQWHLILEILMSGIVDTLCGADVTLRDDTEHNADDPMCEECLKLHGWVRK